MLVAAPAGAFSPEVHQKATSDELSFLRTAIRSEMVEGNLSQDDGRSDKNAATHHVDDCDFSGSTGYIRSRYESVNPLPPGLGVVPWLLRTPAAGSAYQFGRLLHPVQDFYSHSNWIELGPTDLIDERLYAWRVLRGWGRVRDDIVVGEGETLPSGWSGPAEPDAVVPSVDTPTGRMRVLISASSSFDDECHDDMTLLHGDPDFFNKDSSRQPGHEAALELAKRQTRHEWCRLLHLLSDEGGGPEGASVPLGLWARPDRSPHPAKTACALAQKGPVGWSATVTSIRVRDDGDEDSPGELNFALALYSGDFSRSARTQANSGIAVESGTLVAAPGLPPRASICLPAGSRPVVSVQGWDDDDDGGDGILDFKGSDRDDPRHGVAFVAGRGFGAGFVERRVAPSSDLLVAIEVRRSTASSPACLSPGNSPS
jgi:hypothetical protein